MQYNSEYKDLIVRFYYKDGKKAMRTEQDLRTLLNVNISSPFLEEAYKKALQQPDEPEWLTEDYIRKLHAEYGIFPENLETLVLAAKKVSQIRELCLFAKVLCNIIGLRVRSEEAFQRFELPKASDDVKDTMAYDCVAIFPILAHIRSSWKELEARGIEESILRERFSMVDQRLSLFTEKVGRPVWGKGAFMVYGAFVYPGELKIGRLRFEWVEHSAYPVKVFVNREGELKLMMDGVTLHAGGHVLGSYGFTEGEGSYFAEVSESTDAYEGYLVDSETHLAQNFRTMLSKEEWRLAFAPGDAYIMVHIGSGGGFDAVECENSFKKAREVFTRCFPEYDFKGFLTNCWMLGPGLEPALKEGSNIKTFRNYFHIFPERSDANDLFLYVFEKNVRTPGEVDIDALQEKTSLQRGVKELLQKGTYIHEFNGFFLW